jgi:hypothetical protein
MWGFGRPVLYQGSFGEQARNRVRSFACAWNDLPVGMDRSHGFDLLKAACGAERKLRDGRQNVRRPHPLER